ncbi:MAG: hypothetical protein DSY37_05025 [Hyperthermus sp.]|nr:MAG: hypothetical protein DSY37_05025 [Hyperthermus sp.]
MQHAWVTYIIDPGLPKPAKGPVCVDIEDGVILGFSNGCPPGASSYESSVIMPALCNAHMHILDSSIADIGENLELNELVAQPHGVKYKALSSIPRHTLEKALEETLASVSEKATKYTGIYVEMGREGAQLVSRVLSNLGMENTARLLVQASNKSYPEYMSLMREWGGVGLDTALDLEIFELRELAGMGHLHVHVSETEELRKMGDYLLAAGSARAAIHVTFLEPGTVIELALEHGTFPVFCPRSNMYHTGRLPPIESLINIYMDGLPAGLGTDNTAWITPHVAEEMSFAYIMGRGRVQDRSLYALSLLYAVTKGCSKLLGFNTHEWLIIARIPLLNYSHNPVVTVVKRAGELEVLATGRYTSRVDEPLA